MKKTVIVICMALLGYSTLTAQVIISPQLPQVDIKLKQQLWNLSISNSGLNSLTIKISMLMTDMSNGQQVLSATTGLLQLPQGVKLFQYNNVIPVSYTVISNTYNIDASPNGFLPIGNFDVCFDVLQSQNNGETYSSVAEECVPIEVEPVSPPYLNLPPDQSETDDARPVFNWIPPAPAIFFSGLSYDFKLVEVLPSQNPEDAILLNMPVLSVSNHYSNTLQYPASSPALDTGKLYAWQVSANNNGLFIAKTEVWTFRERLPVYDTATNTFKKSYYKLKPESSSAYFICDGILKMAYQNELNDLSVAIAVYDITTKDKKKITLPASLVATRFGQNFIDFDITGITGIANNHFYEVELINSKNEISRARFMYKQP